MRKRLSNRVPVRLAVLNCSSEIAIAVKSLARRDRRGVLVSVSVQFNPLRGRSAGIRLNSLRESLRDISARGLLQKSSHSVVPLQLRIFDVSRLARRTRVVRSFILSRVECSILSQKLCAAFPDSSFISISPSQNDPSQPDPEQITRVRVFYFLIPVP